MKEIILYGKYGKGKVAKIDDDDFDIVTNHRWHVDRCGYARCHEYKRVNPDRPVILMHRLILGEEILKDKYVDHINGDKLDNRRANLRICTNQQNMCNRSKYKRKNKSIMASKYKGVRKYGNNNKWVARISINGKPVHIGVYNTEEEAALAYNHFAKELQGEFAKLNDLDRKQWGED